jgi:hypothetical protein
MAERRQAIRQKSFLRGCVYFNKRRGSLDCLIRDYSETGARIIFSETVSVPDVVDLYIPQKEQTVHARVQWRCGDEIGLAFPDAVRAADGTGVGELALRVAQLESELAGLRRLVKKLRAEITSRDGADAA